MNKKSKIEVLTGDKATDKNMKVIDLLNKIANGEEVPKKIKFCFRTFEYNDMSDYLCIDKNDYSKEDYCNGYSIHKWIFGNNLNDEVEIVKEENKIPEKLDKYYDNDLEQYIVETYIKGVNCREILQSKYDEIIINKINEIIDYLKSKGE